jgi:hypothetical protein
MTARVWTREELDRVHPLPDGWTWAFDESVGWYGRHPGGATVCVDDFGDVLALSFGTTIISPCAAVTIPIILASQGLDSREAMADAMDARRDDMLARAAAAAALSELAAFAEGRAVQAAVDSAMLRRGQVNP